MEEVSRTEAEYVAAISNVLAYIQIHLDDELTPHMLADVACFSQHHFHRIFRAVVGESVMDHVRRLRLERAAYRLKTSQSSVASIAIDAGYGAQEIFTRIFRTYFGVAPRVYRRAHAAHLLPATSGVHFAPAGFTPLRRAVDAELLNSDQLCPAHRQWSAEFEHQWESILSIVTDFSSFIFPPQLRGPHLFLKENNMPDTLTEIDNEISTIQNEIEAAKQRLVEARKRRPKEPVNDYTLQDSEGKNVTLSELFGDKEDLILVHNMGTGCSSCTMWRMGSPASFPTFPTARRLWSARRTNPRCKSGSRKSETGTSRWSLLTTARL